MFLWLSKGELKGETENEIIAAQYRALQTKCQLKILQTERVSTYIISKQFDEAVRHIISTCPLLAKEHDRVCDHLHFNKCKKTGVTLDKNHLYYRVPKTVRESKITVLCN